MEILTDAQYRAMTFVSAANRGGNRPTDHELFEWLLNPRPQLPKKGELIRPGRPAKYRTTSGLYKTPAIQGFFDKIMAMQESQAKSLLSLQGPLRSIIGDRELIEEEIPAEYGPDVPGETFVDHLVRLQWLERDNRKTLGLTPLGRALLRSHHSNEDEFDAHEIVVLDSNDELSYAMLVQKLCEVGEGILIDPYLGLEQFFQIKAYTSISRVLISEQVKRDDRAAMAVLVQSGADHPLELRMSKKRVLHDRMALGSKLAFTIGTSMNTVGRQHPTILTPLPDEASDALRAHAEKWWEQATLIASSNSATVAELDSEPEADGVA